MSSRLPDVAASLVAAGYHLEQARIHLRSPTTGVEAEIADHLDHLLAEVRHLTVRARKES